MGRSSNSSGSSPCGPELNRAWWNVTRVQDAGLAARSWANHRYCPDERSQPTRMQFELRATTCHAPAS